MTSKTDINNNQAQHTKDKHLSILLVEDSKVDAYIVKSALNKFMSYTCHVMHVEDMEQAEIVLKTHKTIDLILLDLGLPDTEDGADTFQRMKGVKEDIPVVIFTSEADHKLAVSLVDSGAEDFINKSSIGKSPELLCNAIDFAVCRHNNLTDIKKQNASYLKEKDMVIQWVTGSYSVM